MTPWPDTFSQAFANPALQRRALSTALTALVHAGLLAIILTVPIYEAPVPRGDEGGGSVDVRLYTVAGPNAQTDAPLNEPMLADRADGAAGNDTSGASDGEETRPDEAAAPQTPVEAPPIAEPPAAEAPAAESLADTPAPAEAERETESGAGATLLTAPGSGNRGLGPDERAPSRPSPAPGAIADAGEPVATTQLRGGGETARPAPPSFADILARAGPSLDPADFGVGALDGDLDAAVRESLCLASSDATREAGACPDGPNPNQAALAAFGLSEPGETPPQFRIDMDRLAFQLAQMGTDPSVIDRLMLGLSEARREAVRAPAVTRQMQRDQTNQTDHLGVSNPFGGDGIPMPDNPGG